MAKFKYEFGIIRVFDRAYGFTSDLLSPFGKNGVVPGKDKCFLFCTRLHGSQRKSTKIVALISILIKRRSKNFLPLTFVFHCATTRRRKAKIGRLKLIKGKEKGGRINVLSP